jgi:hypothetical protein
MRYIGESSSTLLVSNMMMRQRMIYGYNVTFPELTPLESPAKNSSTRTTSQRIVKIYLY